MNPAFDLSTKLLVAGCICFLLFLVQFDDPSNTTMISQPIAEAALDTPWRYTKFGWQNSHYWERATFEDPIASRIHPFIWAAMVLLAVFATMIWTSDKSQIDELFSQKQKGKGMPKIPPKSCLGCGQCANFCIDEWRSEFGQKNLTDPNSSSAKA